LLAAYVKTWLVEATLQEVLCTFVANLIRIFNARWIMFLILFFSIRNKPTISFSLEQIPKQQTYRINEIDLTDYSLLPNDLVSMLTYVSMSGADKDYIPMFSKTNFFLAVLRLNNKVIFNPTKHKT
jgi:hypothetical protein